MRAGSTDFYRQLSALRRADETWRCWCGDERPIRETCQSGKAMAIETLDVTFPNEQLEEHRSPAHSPRPPS
jgi:hypothetical protein